MTRLRAGRGNVGVTTHSPGLTRTRVSTPRSLHDAIEQLTDAGQIAAENEQSLLAKVEAASEAIARGNVGAAQGILWAFIAEVNALKGEKISPSAAAILVQDATAISHGLE